MNVGDPEWWEDVFSNNEAQSLLDASNNIIEAYDSREGERYMEVFIMIPETKIKTTLEGIKKALAFNPSGLFKEFLLVLGESIALEYLEGDLDPDEPTTDIASWFLPES